MEVPTFHVARTSKEYDTIEVINDRIMNDMPILHTVTHFRTEF